jgi:hypothetical protein
MAMKELGLLDLLRYALSGGIAVAVLFLAHPSQACYVIGMDGAKAATLLIGSVLLIGTLIYNIHRALLFPIFLRYLGFFANWTFKWSEVLPWKPSESELRIDRWRWNHQEARRKRWDEWGAQTHSLYCAAWATIAALLVGKYLWGAPECTAWRLSWSAFGIFLLSGIVNNYRLLSSVVAEMRHTPNPVAP